MTVRSGANMFGRSSSVGIEDGCGEMYASYACSVRFTIHGNIVFNLGANIRWLPDLSCACYMYNLCAHVLAYSACVIALGHASIAREDRCSCGHHVVIANLCLNP